MQKKLKNRFLSIALFSTLFLLSEPVVCMSHVNTKVEQDIAFSSMVGVRNNLFVGIISFLKKTLRDEDLKKPLGQFPESSFNNRLLLYGPPGNGKSTLAQEIAKAADCELITLRGSTIVEGFVNKGSENIEVAFAQALHRSIEKKRPVLIFIDEIDAIASSDKSEFRAEHRSAGQTLWMHLDAIQNDPRICFMCATNTKDSLDRAVLDRFGPRAVEIPNPSAEMREKIITHYSKQFHVAFNGLLKEIVERTDGLSIRAIKDIIREIAQERLDSGVPLPINRVYEVISITKNKFPPEEKKDKQDMYNEKHLSIAESNLNINRVGMAITLGKLFAGFF